MKRRRAIYKLLEENGGPPMVDTIQCGLWMETHEDCLGCPHALQCIKAAILSNGNLTPTEVNTIIHITTLKEIQELTGE